MRTEVYEASENGLVCLVENTDDTHRDVNYASVTAPELVRVQVKLGKRIHDVVWVGPGSSHSWWAPAGGKLLDHNGLNPGETLEITSSGPCAFRIDWF